MTPADREPGIRRYAPEQAKAISPRTRMDASWICQVTIAHAFPTATVDAVQREDADDQRRCGFGILHLIGGIIMSRASDDRPVDSSLAAIHGD
jgi:hypothetical protein